MRLRLDYHQHLSVLFYLALQQYAATSSSMRQQQQEAKKQGVFSIIAS
jgi:hypothetical protein